MVESLSDAESEFRLIADASRDVVITIDEQSKILFANAAIFELLGYRPEELIGQSLTTLIPDRMKVQHEKGMARYVGTGERNLERNPASRSAQKRGRGISQIGIRAVLAQWNTRIHRIRQAVLAERAKIAARLKPNARITRLAPFRRSAPTNEKPRISAGLGNSSTWAETYITLTKRQRRVNESR
jgi:PAS domain S-box-containing protein